MEKIDASPAFVALVQATAGAAGGVIASFALQPLEVVKTRIQISESGASSTLETFKEIFSNEGPLGLFRGVVAKCTETGLKNFVYFYIYDALNSTAKRRIKLTTVVKLALGYTAGVGNTTLTMPLEVLATKVQVAKTEGILGVLQSVLQQDGLPGLFRGYWFNVILCVNPAIQNTCFDKLKDAVLRMKAAQLKKAGIAFTYQTYPSLTPLQSFSLGAFAKAVATVITFPLVRIKTILQAGSQTHTSGDKPRQNGALDVFKKLYRGLGSTLTKSVLQAALLYMTKDQIERLVVVMFKISAKMMRRRSGRVKLGVTSGRPLAS